MDTFKILILFLSWQSKSTEGKAWNFKDYKISRSFFGPNDPWAVDRCPERQHEEIVYVPYPEDCTKYQICFWTKSLGKILDTIVVHLVSCFNCNDKEPDCPNGRMIFVPEVHKCFPPSRLLPSENKCGTKVVPEKGCSGPKDTTSIHRLGTSRFYVVQNEKKAGWVDWQGGRDFCKKQGLKLAKIDNLQTEVYVSRLLEKFIRPLGWIDNWYWLDGKFDRKLGTYVWQDTKKGLNYSNFYYRPPRPKGYGDFFDNQGNYLKEPEVEHCLALSMPLPFPKSKKQLVQFPMHTAWWERDCKSNKKGNILCESEDPVCDNMKESPITTSPFIDGSGYYFNEFWPLSDRRFIVSWVPKSYDSAKGICERQNLELYSPKEGDDCLAQVLKPWMREVTSYSFWTDVKYKVGTKSFLYPDGWEVSTRVQNMTRKVQKRGTEISETCVSYTWNNEEFPRNVNFCNCSLSSLVLSPENCENRMGVICQHPDSQSKKCKVLKQNEMMLEFYPFISKYHFTRSAYKQPGSHGPCPSGFSRVSKGTNYWGKDSEFEKSSFQYEIQSPYWYKPENGSCYLSTVQYDYSEKSYVQNTVDEDCNKALGFILCEPKPMKSSSVRGSISKGSLEVPLEFFDM